MNTPLISVILPVYNAGPYLSGSIESILNQSYSNFEFIICDDASSDKSLQIIKKFSDKRIKILQHKSNLGLVATLNECLETAKGDFIARMDNDDIAHPKRLEKQLQYLLHNPRVALIGCLYARIDNFGKITTVDPVMLKQKDVRLALSIKNCFCHGAVMFNIKVIPKKLLKYSEKYKHAEDYFLWSTFSKNNLILENIPEVLYFWRSHQSSISKLESLKQDDSFVRLLNDNKPLRNRATILDLLIFSFNGLFAIPTTLNIAGSIYPTHLTRDHQYILYRWSTLMKSSKPIMSIIALFLSFIISPMNICKIIQQNRS